MKTNSLPKKTRLTVLSSFLLLIAFNSTAQQGVGDVIPGSGKPSTTASGGSGKSVYDVIPGSGPKKTTKPAGSGKTVYDVIPGSGPKKTTTNPPVGIEKSHHDKTYTNKKRKSLPPGQAKKIYGGSATDYAPGQVKKQEGHQGGNNQGHDNNNQHHHDHKSGKNHHN